MLDLFLKRGWVIMSEEGEIRKTSTFPKEYTYLTDVDGVVTFFYDYKTHLVPIHPNQLIENE